MLTLTDMGWHYVRKVASKKQPPYGPESNKQWFYDKTIMKPYLQVLVKADEFFQAGLQWIHHYQPSGYYRALLVLLQKDVNLLNKLKPGQPFTYYKNWIQNSKKSTPDIHDDIDRIDSEDVTGS